MSQFSKLNHRLGGASSFDGDMDLIENMVELTKDPESIILALQLNLYYMSAALLYWKKLDEYFEEGAYDPGVLYTNPELKFYYRNNQVEVDESVFQIDKYEDNFMKLLDNIEKNKNIFDHKKIIQLFLYIADMNCLKAVDADLALNNLERILDLNKCYLITNENGSFSFNTWLYAYFEDVHLLGVTSKQANFDGNVGCSLEMFVHDISHISIIKQIPPEEFIDAKKLYYFIHNKIDDNIKEILLLTLWISIHEVGKIDFSLSIKNLIELLIPSVDFNEFGKIFRSYSFLYDKDLIEDFIKYSDQNNLKDTINSLKKYRNAKTKFPYYADSTQYTLFDNLLIGIYYSLKKIKDIISSQEFSLI